MLFTKEKNENRVSMLHEKIYKEYKKGVLYKNELDLFDRVKENEDFFIGNQWPSRVGAAELDKPVFNILKRSVSYFVSSIVSDDVSTLITPYGKGAMFYDRDFLQAIAEQIDEVIESAKVKQKNRDAVRNAAVDGDACFYIYYDPNIETGQLVKGAIKVEVINNTNIFFENNTLNDIQNQDYIIISYKESLKKVIEEGLRNSIPRDELSKIKTDKDYKNNEDKVTVLAKFYKQKGKDGKTTVHMVKTTKDCVIMPPKNLHLNLYPFAYFSWDKVKGSCHGQAAVTGLIPNQIFINKLFSMSMEQVKSMAFPKIIYNKKMLPKWDNRVGTAIGVEGDITQAVATGFRAPDMSNQVLSLIDKTISATRDTLGTSDVVLGNVDPNNTSAIIALQQSSTVPLELQKQAFYQFVEDYVRVFLDIMRVNYGIREVVIKGNDADRIINVDFSKLENMFLRLNVQVGAAAYWSELMQVQTLDNLFDKGIITDPELYLNSMPNGYVPNRQNIIRALKAKEVNVDEMQGLQS